MVIKEVGGERAYVQFKSHFVCIYFLLNVSFSLSLPRSFHFVSIIFTVTIFFSEILLLVNNQRQDGLVKKIMTIIYIFYCPLSLPVTWLAALATLALILTITITGNIAPSFLKKIRLKLRISNFPWLIRADLVCRLGPHGCTVNALSTWSYFIVG